MSITNVGPDSSLELQEVADVIGKARKTVVITGAGISTNCGIPDFRSQGGLYSLIQEKYDTALLTRPWDNKDNYDIDDRPKKKRKMWFYEVVAPDGTVVQTIDESEDPAPKQSSRKSSENLSSSPTNSPPPPPEQTPPLEAVPATSARSSRSKSSTPATTPPLEKSQQSRDPVAPPTSRRSSKSPLRSSSPLSSPPPSSRAESVSTSEQTDDSSSADSSIVSSIESSQSSRADLPNLKGRDLFDSMVWKDPFTTSIHYMFISSLREKIQDVSSPTPTHEFIKSLQDVGRLVRNYTQNIDCLEERLGMATDLTLGPGSSRRFHAKVQREQLERWEQREKTLQSNGQPTAASTESDINGGVPVVQLHGSLAELRCGLCLKTCSWDEADRATIIGSGQAPDCPFCMEYNARRTGRGRRGLAVGRLRPDIVLYGEEHPHANLVGPIITHDLALGPDVLIILGTSLRVHGLKVIIKEFAKTVHDRGGKVVFVNRTKPPESTWKEMIDYWVEWDCDAWVLDLKERRPDIWSPPSSSQEEPRSRISMSRRESSGEAKLSKGGSRAPRPQCTREDRTSAAHHTFKILDILRPLPDENGKPATREQKWPDLRRATGSARTVFKPYKASTSSLAISKSAPAQSSKKPTVPSKRKRAITDAEHPLGRPCVSCVKRRTGCDRKFPCDRCTRLMIECVPSEDPAPSPKKRKSLHSFDSNGGQPSTSSNSRPPSSKTPASKATANTSRKRKQPGGVPEDQAKRDHLAAAHWDKLRSMAPSLSEKPSPQIMHAGRMPLMELYEHIPQDWRPHSREFFNKQTESFRRSFPAHYPDVAGLDDPLPNLFNHNPPKPDLPGIEVDDMPTLITHPPSGYIPSKPLKPAPRHSYGTRAKTSMYNPEPESPSVHDKKPSRPSWGSSNSNESTIVVDASLDPDQYPTQEPTPPDSASMSLSPDSLPLTPDSKRKRIKRMTSIGAILSSSPHGTDIFQDAPEGSSPHSMEIFQDAKEVRSSPTETETEGEVWHDAKGVLSSSPEMVRKGSAH